MKTDLPKSKQSPVEPRRAAAAHLPGTAQGGDPLNRSPALLAQRQRIESAFGPAAQLVAPGDRAESNRTGMPDGLKAGIESLSGMDMSDVRVHANSARPSQLNALAYAQGNDIHLGPGQDKHLPHEAWHLVQQRQGRVQPTTQVAGVNVNDDPSLEQEADTMGAKAQSVPAQAKAKAVGGGNVGPVAAQLRSFSQALTDTGVAAPGAFTEVAGGEGGDV